MMRPGKTPLSCIPCAKRKVRCDKQLPCCHCKRRPQDKCRYPSNAAPSVDGAVGDLSDRVLELEQYIRTLGHDPKAACPPTPATPATPGRGTAGHAANNHSHAQSMVKVAVAEPPSLTNSDDLVPTGDGEEPSYIESPMWYSFAGLNLSEDDKTMSSRLGKRLPPSATRSTYLPSILEPTFPQDPTHCDLSPLTTLHMNFIWKTFLKNVHPQVKIFIGWEIEPMIQKSTEGGQGLTNSEKALISAITFMSITSLSNEECLLRLHAQQSELLTRCQQATESQLLSVRYASTTNKVTLQAYMLYIHAMSERAHPATIYSLMGIAVRVAERMGLHRDGDALGLSPLRSEERRRMWWQLQYMEITITRFIGSLTLSIFADWDAKMPSNLEDHDLKPDMDTLPPERTKLTEISQCLWCYTVLGINRGLQKRKSDDDKSLAWALNPNVPLTEKDALMDMVESILRRKFLQFCEPLNPLHLNLQLGISKYILAGRRLVRQPALVNAKISEMSKGERDEFLEICVKSLEYSNMAQTYDSLKGYIWHNRIYFPWVAFIYVILESFHRFDQDEAMELWSLIQRTYVAYPELTTTVHRQDVVFAARITTTSWQKHASHIQQQMVDLVVELPTWVSQLYDNFDIPKPEEESDTTEDYVFPDLNLTLGTDFDFDMIDWSSWDESLMTPRIHPVNG